MNPLEEILTKKKILILDGAFATELEKKGYDINDPLWSAKFLLENPEAICEVHKDYLEAGADCITTASYQATYEAFMKRGLSEDEAKALIKSSVALAKKTRDAFWAEKKNKIGRVKPLIAASIGPYGAYLADGSEYRGEYNKTQEQLIEFHTKRMQSILEATPDILACETIPCLIEAKALSTLIAKLNASAWICFSAKDGKHINSGEKISECAQYLDDKKHISAIGINCTPPQYVASLIQEIRKVSNKPIVVYPNGGASYDGLTKTWSECAQTSSYEKMAKLWYDEGATIIGGCCLTTPQDISNVAKWAKTL